MEGEIKTTLCHQLQRFAPVYTIAPDQEMVSQLLPDVNCVVLLAGMCLAVNRAENWHRGPETILKRHHRGSVRRLASTPVRESQPASRWRCWPSSKSSWSGVVILFLFIFFLTKPARLLWLSRLLIRFYLTADSKTEAPSVLPLLNPIRQMWRPCKSPGDGKIE